MNFSSLLGMLFACGVLLFGLMTASSNWKVFFDSHAIAIVIGGTLAAAMICFSYKNLLNLISVFFKKIVGKFNDQNDKLIQEIVMLAKGNRESTDFLEKNLSQIKNPFLKEAVGLLVDGGISDEKMDEILFLRAQTHYKRYEEDANIFKVISKFPPAFGLLGTTLGMIALLQNMGSPESFKLLGPAMAIGLVATLYGIAMANFVFIPMGENLSQLNREDQVSRKIVIKGVQLIREGEHPMIVEEFLKSFLLPSERKSTKKAA